MQPYDFSQKKPPKWEIGFSWAAPLTPPLSCPAGAVAAAPPDPHVCHSPEKIPKNSRKKIPKNPK